MIQNGSWGKREKQKTSLQKGRTKTPLKKILFKKEGKRINPQKGEKKTPLKKRHLCYFPDLGRRSEFHNNP
jgi:hypothetical protein